MKIEALLSRLEKVKGRNGSWTACCPAHADRSPSLSVRETDDGRILLHCFGGCSVDSVLGAVGMDMEDLFPDRPTGFSYEKGASKPERTRFYASDLLRIIGFESTLVMVAAHDMAKGKRLTQQDMDRLMVACQRINSALEAGNVRA
jgi:CHC2 zinc finger